MYVENEDGSFTLKSNDGPRLLTAFSEHNQTDTNDKNSNDNDIINIVIMIVIGVISCSMLSGLIYLYHHNNMLPQGTDFLGSTTNPLGRTDDDINVSIGSEADFYGGNPPLPDELT